MIRVIKPIIVPNKLLTEGVAEDNKNALLYDANPQKCINGNQSIEIFNYIYGHVDVKSVLKKAQHNKCCFCEKEQRDERGAVEHFRPKGGYQTNKKTKLIKPGYYWCGYTWSNLFFVCNRCNEADNKGTLFPLLNETKRARSHHDDINNETPLLLDPSGRKDPRKHICFEGSLVKGKSIYGRSTIRICGLDREALNDKREKLIGDIQARIDIALNKRSKKKSREDAIAFLKAAQEPEAEFCATAQDYIRGKIVLI